MYYLWPKISWSISIFKFIIEFGTDDKIKYQEEYFTKYKFRYQAINTKNLASETGRVFKNQNNTERSSPTELKRGICVEGVDEEIFWAIECESFISLANINNYNTSALIDWWFGLRTKAMQTFQIFKRKLRPV